MAQDIDGAALATELQQLIAFRPVTGDHKASLALLDYVKAELLQLGLAAEIRTHETYNYLVAGTQSRDRSKILLQAHIDVVPAPDELFAMRRDGDKLIGRGAYDMLFGTAAFLATLRLLNNEAILDKLDVGIMLSSDEEIGGFKTAKPVMEKYSCDICFLPDAGSQDTLSTSAKGVLQVEIVFAGRSGHAGRPLEYDNPIYKLASCIAELRERFPNNDPVQTVCSITTAEAGKALNQVPDSARMTLDIRYVAYDDPIQLIQDVSIIAERYNGQVRELVREPAFRTSKNNVFVKEYVNVHKKCTGRVVRYMSAPGSSDARFLSQKNIPVIMIRPDGGGLHAPDEWVSLSSLVEYAGILAAYLRQAGQSNVLVDKHP